MRPFDELVQSPLWPVAGSPDIQSTVAATRVQMLLTTIAYGDPADYIVEEFGETREQAEAIVENCKAINDED